MAENTEKTISLDSTRLFRVSTVLAVLSGGSVSFLNPVEVRVGARIIGWASITFSPHTGSLYADLVFPYASPERLSIETGSEKLYARVEGVFELANDPWERVGALDVLDQEDVLKNLLILGIEIGHKPAFQDQPNLSEVVL